MAEIDIETILRRYNPWWAGKCEHPGVLRESYIKTLLENLKNRQIIFLTGIRRVGKTTIIKQFIERLIQNKISPEEILFVSLDDPSVSSLSISEIIESFRKINSLPFDKKTYLFFDEISYKEDFSRELKVINDNQNVKILASGSNSLELMDKKAYLTGRVFNIRVCPLNFEEYLLFNNLSIKPQDKHLLEKHFEEFLKIGGMPEYVLTKNPEYLTNVIEDIIHKDIARAYKIRNIEKLKEVFILLCERVGKKISYHKLASICGLDKETVADYISYFQRTFLFSIIQRYSKSLNERIYSQKKVYISDTGIRTIFSGYKDKGSLFENFVFNELSKKFREIYYFFENNKEIDFIVKGKKETAIEVKFREVSEEDVQFFNKIEFKEKSLVKNYQDLKILLEKIQ